MLNVTLLDSHGYVAVEVFNHTNGMSSLYALESVYADEDGKVALVEYIDAAGECRAALAEEITLYS